MEKSIIQFNRKMQVFACLLSSVPLFSLSPPPHLQRNTPPPTLTDEQSAVSIFRSVMGIWGYNGVVF